MERLDHHLAAADPPRALRRFVGPQLSLPLLQALLGLPDVAVEGGRRLRLQLGGGCRQDASSAATAIHRIAFIFALVSCRTWICATPSASSNDPHPSRRQLRAEWIETLAAAPARFRDAVRGLSDEQLDTPYRPDGWTRPAGDPPRCRQPHELVHSLPAGADRGRARPSSLRRSQMGAA